MTAPAILELRRRLAEVGLELTPAEAEEMVARRRVTFQPLHPRSVVVPVHLFCGPGERERLRDETPAVLSAALEAGTLSAFPLSESVRLPVPVFVDLVFARRLQNRNSSPADLP